MDTLVGGQLYLRPYSQNHVSISIQTLCFYIPVSGQFPVARRAGDVLPTMPQFKQWITMYTE